MKQIHIFLLVVLSVYDVIHSANTPAPEQEHHHPKYTYTCNEDLSVTFKGVNGVVKYFSGGNENCNIVEEQDHKGNFRIKKECFLSSDINTDRKLYVTVFDKNERERTPTAPSSPTTTLSTPPPTTKRRLVVTGRHIFKITCTPISDQGVVKYAVAETGVKDVDTLRPKPNQVAGVEMFLKNKAKITSPDVSEVFIGDMFFMYLLYKGAMHYTIQPNKCHANRGNWRLKEDVLPLWEPSGKCLSQAANDYKIMERFVRDNETMVHAKLHGFRFAKVPQDNGDDDITITCEVKICKGECSDTAKECKLTTPHNRRRRRQINSDITTQTVSRKITVKDTGSNSGGHTTFNRSILLLVVVMTFLNR